MREVRRRFHEELRALEGEVQRTGTQAQRLLEQALQALTRRDVAVCEAVIRGDDEVDQLYLDVERRILGLFALQTPVASDLRLLTALLHINLHLERIADQAVNMAKITIDRLNRGMLQQVLGVSDDKQMLEWGIRMYVVSRQIERVGDNAVDIAEQVAFLVTGEFREFTDASHPEIEHPELLERGGSPE
jgi:phosphate transport system protein